MAHACRLPRDDRSPAMSVVVCDGCGAVWEAAVGDGIFDFDLRDVVVRRRWLLVEPAAPARLLAS